VSAIVSTSKNFIFIHVPKTGGVSIHSILHRHDDVPPRLTALLRTANQLCFGLDNREVHIGNFHYFDHHPRAEHVCARIGAGKYDSMISFVFVRNPWSWVVSNYAYRQKVLAPVMPQIPRQTFEEYLEGMEQGPNLAHGGLYHQSDFLFSSAGTQLLSCIGRFESFAADLARISAMIGIPFEKVPALNQSSHADFRQYYTPQTSDLVRRLYAPDIERFGYEADAPC
jgi:hypothetical protein